MEQVADAISDLSLIISVIGFAIVISLINIAMSVGRR